MRFLVFALFAFSTSALAASPIDKMRGSIGAISMDADRVDVPLYSAPSGYPYPSVQVTIGENVYLFKVDTGSTMVYVASRVIQDQELKVRVGNKRLINLQGEPGKFKVGGERKFTELDEIRIGGLILQDVVAATHDEDDYAKIPDIDAPSDSDLGYAGVIGLGTLPSDISWAIRPSAGEVSFARGEAGAGLASAGTTAPYRSADSFKYKYGLAKGIKNARPLLVDLDIGGVTHSTILMSSRVGGYYRTEKPTPASVNDRLGDIYYRYHDVSLGGTVLDSGWLGEYTLLPESPGAATAVLGSRFLHRFDLALDSAASTITLSEVGSGTWHDPREFLIAEALKAVAPPEEGEEAEAGDQAATDDANAKPPGSAKAWSKLKDLYIASADLPQALAAQENVLAFDKRSCEAWISMGELQVLSGDFEAAATSYEAASKGYHAWYGLSLEERKELDKEWKKLDQEEKDASAHYPAASACHKADGHLAVAKFALGDLSGVEALYQERFDLDANLALIAANAMISRGEFAAAQSPLRQSLKQGHQKSWTRLALAMVYADSGDWGQASALFDRSLKYAMSTQSVKVWLDALAKSQGQDATIEAAKAFVASEPGLLAPHFGLAYALRQSEDEAARAAAREQGDSDFEKALAERPRSGSVWAMYARWLNLWGDTERAESAVEKALSLNPGSAVAYIARSEVYASSGESTRATQYLVKAAQAMPLHPGYARLINAAAQ